MLMGLGALPEDKPEEDTFKTEVLKLGAMASVLEFVLWC
jgi:hypothetical protein